MPVNTAQVPQLWHKASIALIAHGQRGHQQALRACKQHSAASPPPHSPLCLAKVVKVAPGCKGLLASRHIRRGQPALKVAPWNTLAAPRRVSNLYKWECEWLEPFEKAHGALPPLLVDFLIEAAEDTTLSNRTAVEGLLQLTALVLYVKQAGAAAAAAGRRSFWHDWMQTLPTLEQATAPVGVWSGTELQQLQSAVAANNQAYLQLCEDFFAYIQTQLAGLGLAESVSDVLQALFIAKTRSVSSSDCLYLLPMHDFLNHADSPNCSVSCANGWHIVAPTCDVESNVELSISYTGQEPSSSLDMLLSWGFVTNSQLLDVALPQTYQLLPALNIDLVAAAAAAVLLQDQSNQGSRQKQTLQLQVLAAAASLPLAGLTDRHGWHGVASAAAVAASEAGSTQQGPGANDSCHRHLATLLAKYGLFSLCPWLVGIKNINLHQWPAAVQQQQHLHLPSQQQFDKPDIDMYELYIPQDSQQQAARVQDLQQHVGASAQLLVNTASRVNTKELQQHMRPSPAINSQHLQHGKQYWQVQYLTARACWVAAELQLLGCNTTTEQDERLLVLLRQQQQQQQQLHLQQHQQGQPKVTATAATATAFAGADTPVGVDVIREQQLLKAHELQLSILAELILLQACWTVASSSSSSNEKQAARQLIGLLSELPVPAAVAYQPQQQQQVIQRLMGLQEQQVQLLGLLGLNKQQQKQQQHAQEHQQFQASGFVGSVVQDSLQHEDDPGCVNPMRLETAVTARLVQKQLLSMLSSLLQVVIADIEWHVNAPANAPDGFSHV